MEIKWNIDDLNKIYNDLSNLKSNNRHETKIISNAIEIYQNIINDYNYGEEKNKDRKKAKIKNISLNYNSTLKDYKYTVENTDEKIFKFITEVTKKVTKDKNMLLNTSIIEIKDDKVIKEEDLYNEAIAFFNKYLKEYTPFIENLFKNNFINYSYDDTSSYTYYDQINKLIYILLDKNYKSQLTEQAIHELGHAIHNKNNKTAFLKRNAQILEVPAMVPELIYNFDEMDKIKLISIANYLEYLKECFVDTSIINKLYNKNISKEKIIEEYKKYDKYNKESYKDNYLLGMFSNIDSYIDQTYMFSIILSLHMFKIFNEDNEKGLYLYNRLIKNVRSPESLFKLTNFDIKDTEYGTYLFNEFDKTIKENKKRLLK